MSLLGDKLRALAAEADAREGETPAATLPIDHDPAETPEAYYLRKNPDVAAHPAYGNDPYKHWVDHGVVEGRPSLWPSPVAIQPPSLTWPRLVRQHGVNIMARAPLHPEWRPSQTSWIFGHDNQPDGSPLTFVSDPSNAPEGYPPRSSSGWPLVYAGVHWNGLEWVGPPVGPARYQCGEGSFDTEGQALAEARRIAASAAAPADPGWAQVHERMQQGRVGEPEPLPPGPQLPPGEEPL